MNPQTVLSKTHGRIALWLFSCLLLVAPVAATTYTSDGSLADVQRKIDAASAGDTVVIPAGTHTWGAGGAQLQVDKAITLTGASRSGTVIDIDTSARSWSAGVIVVSAAATIRTMTIEGPAANVAAISCHTADGWRVTDISWTGGSEQQYFVYAVTCGLIDNCAITGNTGDTEFIFTKGPENSWQTVSSMGTANAVYVEDCVFNNLGYTDFNANARAVVRFCTFNGAQKVDSHGKFSNTPARSARHTEVYHNTWSSHGCWTAMELRGGTGMVFNNTVPSDAGDNEDWLILTDYYVLNAGYTSANYPIDDQIGIGIDPKAAASEPMYLWGNRRGSTNWTALRSAYGFSVGGVIDPDRDYYEEVSSFTGASGVGTGTKAQMQALVPSKVGVGFWVTDEGSWRSGHAGASGQLYVWDGSSWGLEYTPYTYPHPLRTVSPTSPPVFSAQPVAASSYTSGTSALLSVFSSNAASYRWQFFGDGGGTWSDISDGAVYSGADTASLSINVSLSLDGFRYRAIATNANGSTVSSEVTLRVNPPAPVVSSPGTAAASLGTPFSYSITATNSPTSFSASGLPGGLGVNPSTGGISGTPSFLGTSTVTLGATNAGGTGTAILTLTVGAASNGDAIAPSAPSALVATPVSASRIEVSWAASTDNIGVVGYIVRRDGVQIAATISTAYSDTGLASASTHSYTVVAYDAANNQTASSSVSATTAAGSPLAVDGVATPVSCANCSSVSLPVAIGSGSDRLLIVSASIAWPSAPTATLDGTAMTLVGGSVTTGPYANYGGAYMWYAVAPSTGSHLVAVNNGTSNSIIAGAVSFTGVDQTDPIRAHALAEDAGAETSSVSIAVASAPGDIVVGHVATGGGVVGDDGGQTQQWLRNVDPSNAANNAACSTKAGASSVTLGWTVQNDLWMVVAASLRSASGAVALPVITSSATATGRVGSDFSYAIAASNLPTSYSATGLPWGLTIDTSTGVISGLPEAAGAFSVTLGATNSGGSGTKTLELTIQQPEFAVWVAGFGLGEADRAPEDCPAHDGLPNLVKYALGLSPSEAATAGRPELSVEGGKYVFRFTRSLLATGVICTVQTSVDLVNWIDLSTTVESATATSQLLAAELPSGQARCFARLRVIQQ
jgi:hypothetical protein